MLGSRGIFRVFGAVSALLFVAAANAQVIFSNVTIGGSLSAGATFVTGPTYIDFLTPSARVGDTEPVRSGNISILYDAETFVPMIANDLLLNVLGALSGSGKIFLNEVIEDISNPQLPVVIGQHNAVLDQNSQLPYTHRIVFDHASRLIRVKKEFTLVAPDTQAFDFASVGLIQQTISLVPEPGTLLAIGAGLSALALRRRRK